MLRCMLPRPINVRRPVNIDQFLDGTVIRGLRLFINLDIQHFRTAAVETRCRARVCQCIFAARKYCWLVGFTCYFRASRLLTTFFFTLKPGQIRVAEYLGSDLYPLLLDLHFD